MYRSITSGTSVRGCVRCRKYEQERGNTMFLGMSFAIWLPWILGFGALLVDWYIGLVVWAKEDEKDKKN